MKHETTPYGETINDLEFQIAELKRENAELMKALRPFAEIGDYLVNMWTAGISKLMRSGSKATSVTYDPRPWENAYVIRERYEKDNKMKTVKELFPNCENGYNFSTPRNYQPLLEELGKILVQVEEESPTGDLFILYQNYENPEKYGFLICSQSTDPCPGAIERCISYKEIDDLLYSLKIQIQWFNTPDDCLDHTNKRNWEEGFFGRRSEFFEFKKAAQCILLAQLGREDASGEIEIGKLVRPTNACCEEALNL